MTDISATSFFRQAAGETYPRPQLPPEQEDALGHPDFIEHKRRSLNLAKNPVPGTAIWRGEAREGEPHEALQHSGVGMHWTVNPDSAFTPPPKQGQRRVFWQGRVDHPEQQAIPRSHPSWGGNNGHSMDHEAEVRLHPGSSVHIDGAYVWHGQGDPQGHPVPRKPERTHPDWKWHPVGQHAQVHNHGHISYDLGTSDHHDATVPPPWTGANPRAVLEHEHAAGNHHSTHPGGSYDDIDWDASDEHVDGHSAAVMTDGTLKDGWIKPHELDDHDASEWLRWHPDRAGIEQRHGITTHASSPDDDPACAYTHASPCPAWNSLAGQHTAAQGNGRFTYEIRPNAMKSLTLHGYVNGQHAGSLEHTLHGNGAGVAVDHLHTNAGVRGQGVASSMMDALHTHYPNSWINHGTRTPDGTRWWNRYNDPAPHRNIHNVAPTDHSHGMAAHWTQLWDPHEVANDARENRNTHIDLGLNSQRAQQVNRVTPATGDGRQRGTIPLRQQQPPQRPAPAGDGRQRGTIQLRPSMGAVDTASPEWIAEWGHGSKPCPCCQGAGEHGTGFECYLCDGAMTVGKDTPENYRCDGTLPDGGHGKTATLTTTAAVQDGDDIPSRLLNPHGHHVKARVGGHTNVEMVPRHEVERYASQPTDDAHTKEVGTHVATTGEMEPLLLHYHPASGEAYLGEGNHRLRASKALGMDHVPLRVSRNNYGLPGPGVKVPQDHPAIAAGEHVPADIHPSHIGLTAVDKPSIPQVDLDSARHDYNLTGRPRLAAADTPVPDNDQPYEHEHPWLPHDHFFAPGEKGLDERLFDGDRMRPEVRRHILSLINSFWAPRYGDSWQSWARVYLAGSEASHFYGNSDLDVLIGVDYDALHQHVDAFTGEPDAVIDEKLTNELRERLNDDARMLPGPDGKETGPWESTWYVNPGSYDIRELKPYAAYDITRDEWAVKPVEVPEDFGPEKLPESTWDVFDALQKLIKAIAELPDSIREREGAALYDYLHADRHSAFGPEGSGLYDPANAVWKALDKAPGKPLQQLIDWKHAHDGNAATDLETAA